MRRPYTKRVRANHRPEAEDKVYDRLSTDLPINSVVSIAIVQDPYKPEDKIKVLRSHRDDPLEDMKAHDRIDKAQYDAGRRWQEHYEASEIGAVIALDTTKEPVDGHGPPRPHITERQLKAFKELKRADDALGLEGRVLVRDVLGHRLSTKEAAIRRGLTSRHYIEYMSLRFREALETLAILWGYAAPKYHRP